jgi:hypothetical protein
MKHRKHVAASLALALIFSVLYTATRTHPESTARTVKTQTHRKARTPPRNEDTDTLKQFQKTDFYRTIIDNNLFRPLGWTPPRPQDHYRLLGTILPKDDRTPPTAIIETTIGHTTYIVSINDNLDADTKVISIKNKSVTISINGHHRTLRLLSAF